jgi:cell division protein FtsI/penicillin-binding protein 2
VSEASSRLVAALMKDTMTAAASEFAVDFAGVEIAGMIAETPIPANGKYSQSDFNVLAAGFYPTDNPRWVVAIGFSKPKPEHSAGRVALPLFAEIVRKTSSMKNFGVKP